MKNKMFHAIARFFRILFSPVDQGSAYIGKVKLSEVAKNNCNVSFGEYKIQDEEDIDHKIGGGKDGSN